MSWTIRKRLLTIAVAGSALLSAAFVTSPASAANVVMRMSAEPSDVGLMHWWAMDKGIFKKNNLKYAFTQVNTAAIALQAIGAGTNDVVSLTEPPIIYNVTKGIEVVITGAVATRPEHVQAGDAEVDHQRRAIQGQEGDLDGGHRRRIRLDPLSASKKIPLKKFDFVNLEPSEGVPALINGSVQGLWEWEPWPRKAVSIKPDKFHVIAASSDETYQGYYITVVRKKFAEEHPKEVIAYLKSLREAAESDQRAP